MPELTEKKGGPGSGHHGHRGRPGRRGGSAPGKGTNPTLEGVKNAINRGIKGAYRLFDHSFASEGRSIGNLKVYIPPAQIDNFIDIMRGEGFKLSYKVDTAFKMTSKNAWIQGDFGTDLIISNLDDNKGTWYINMVWHGEI